MLKPMPSHTSAEVLLLRSGHHILRKTQTAWNVSKGQVARLEVVQEKRLHEDKKKELGTLSIKRKGLGGTLSSPEGGIRFMFKGTYRET